MIAAQVIISALFFLMGFACLSFVYVVLHDSMTVPNLLMMTAALVSAVVLIWVSTQAFPVQKVRSVFATQASPCAQP